MIKIVNSITHQELYSKTPEKTVKEILNYHNTVWVKNGEIHYPENAYAEQNGEVITIRKRKLL